MTTLHHAPLMASDIDAKTAFRRDGFGGEVAADLEFAGAGHVFLSREKTADPKLGRSERPAPRTQ